MTYTHIKIEQIPQRLNENFSKNADIADQQKRLAEAAPDLLVALKVMVKMANRTDLESLPEINQACEAIARAEGKQQSLPQF